MTPRLLVTAVGGNIGQGVVKALRSGRRDYFIVGTDMEPRSVGFSLVDRAYELPAADDARFFDRLVAILRAERVEAIFVCSPAELAGFIRARSAVEAATRARVLINPERVIAIGQDKLETIRFLAARGFCSPDTAAAADSAAVDALIERCGFPVIAKPRCGWTAANVFCLHSRDAIEAAATLVPDLVVQQYLPDPAGEYTAGVVGSAAGGAFAWIVLRRDLVQGTTYRTELAQDPKMGAQIVSMAQALGVEGACNFQFRMLDGQPCVFEINPRFSGTSGIRYLYGFNDPEMVFDLMCLGQPVQQPEVRPGVVLRYWNEIHVPDARFDSPIVEFASRGRQVVFPAPGIRQNG